MKVLYVVTRPMEINTSASIRNKAMILGLKECGCDVDMITTTPDKNHMAYDASMVLEGVKTTYIDLGATEKAAKILRKYKWLSPIKKLAAKILSKKNVYDNLVRIIDHVDEVDLEKNAYDVIISSSDPKSSHLFVYELLKKNSEYKGKWIQIWGDPFLGDITSVNKDISKIKSEERKLLEAADRIVYVSALTMNKQKEIYPSAADKMLYAPVPYTHKKEYPNRNLVNEDTVKLAYCGDYLTSVRNILPLYEAVNASDKFRLTVCGMSDRELIGTDKVTVLSRVGQERVAEIEAHSDILIHLSNKSGTQIPGKIYHYSGTNKPILFILDGDSEQLLESFSKYDRYVFTDNGREDICRAIKSMVDNPKAYAPVQDFSPKDIAERVLIHKEG